MLKDIEPWDDEYADFFTPLTKSNSVNDSKTNDENDEPIYNTIYQTIINEIVKRKNILVETNINDYIIETFCKGIINTIDVYANHTQCIIIVPSINFAQKIHRIIKQNQLFNIKPNQGNNEKQLHSRKWKDTIIENIHKIKDKKSSFFTPYNNLRIWPTANHDSYNSELITERSCELSDCTANKHRDIRIEYITNLLDISVLHQFSFNMPATRAEMNGLERLLCASSMRKGVNNDALSYTRPHIAIITNDCIIDYSKRDIRSLLEKMNLFFFNINDRLIDRIYNMVDYIYDFCQIGLLTVPLRTTKIEIMKDFMHNPVYINQMQFPKLRNYMSNL